MAALSGLFYGSNKMATDVDVQFFSHLNGLTLGNNWGDLIRLFDTCLATGKDLPDITAASIDEQGDVHLTFYTAHQAMLLQIIELSGFTPSELNQKYRIKGVPDATQLILKPALDITERSITTIGTGKLASLGYDIIFRDTGDVKRVYRAKNPTAQHPFIRVDESLASDTGSYTNTYIKSAMVGLLEHMDHIDDYQNPDVLQLPFDPADPGKNWKITGTGTSVQRGWSLWHWAWNASPDYNINATNGTLGGNRGFTLCGDSDAFYLNIAPHPPTRTSKFTYGCGLFDSSLDSSVVPSWFLATTLALRRASDGHDSTSLRGGFAFGLSDNTSRVFVTKYTPASPISAHVSALPVMPNYQSGISGFASAGIMPCISIPLKDDNNYLRGTFKHIAYNAKSETVNETTPRLAESSMYVLDTLQTSTSGSGNGSSAYYLGELK